MFYTSAVQSYASRRVLQKQLCLSSERSTNRHESGNVLPQAMNFPLESTTSTTSPAAGFPSTRNTAPPYTKGLPSLRRKRGKRSPLSRVGESHLYMRSLCWCSSQYCTIQKYTTLHTISTLTTRIHLETPLNQSNDQPVEVLPRAQAKTDSILHCSNGELDVYPLTGVPSELYPNLNHVLYCLSYLDM